MKLRDLALIGWIVVFLSLVEVALETRAHLNGWNTLIYGPVVRASVDSDRESDPSSPTFGPTAAFPFRSEIVAGAAPDGVDRIWIASASHGEDVHLPADVIFPHLVGVERTSSGRPTQVLNASRAGHDIASNGEMLVREAPTWKPDVVLLYQASIDIGRLAKEVDPLGGVGPTAAARSGASQPAWLQQAFESTTTYELLAGTVRAWLGTQRVLTERLSDEALARYEAVVREFVATTRAAGARPVLATFATSHTKEDLGAIPEHIVLGVFQFNDQLSMAAWLDAIERCNAVIRAVAAEEEITVVPVAEELTGRDQHFRDLVHFSPSGHAIVAKTIAAALAEPADTAGGLAE